MSSGGSSGGSTTTTQSGPPPQVMQAYEGLVNAASGVASQPLQQYTDPMVAGFTPQQQAGFQTIDNSQGIGFPYINAAAQQYGQATAPLWDELPHTDTGAVQNVGQNSLAGAANAAQWLASTATPWTTAAGYYGNQAGNTAAQIPGVVAPYTAEAVDNAGLASYYAQGLIPGAAPYTGIGTNQSGTVATLANQIPGGLSPYQYQGALAADVGANNAGAAAGAVANVAGGLQGGAQPYQYAASRGIQLPGYNTLDTYLSPYTKNVTNALQDLFNQQNAEQFQQIRGNATTQGAYGGDREAVAEAITARQQQLGEAPALSQALQSGFAQAQNELNTQQNLQLQRQQAERQLSLGAGQLGLGAGQAAGQLGIGAGQLGLSGQQLAAQTQLQAGQLGLGGYQAAGQLGLGAGQLGLGAGQLNLAAGQAGVQGATTAGQLQLAAGQQNLAAYQAAQQGQLGTGQLNTGIGQLALGAGTAGMQGQLAASQAGFGEFNTQQAQQLAADQANRWLASQAGFGMASLGNQALSQALTGANAEIGAGALQQQLAQEQLNIPYQQFLQAQAYPYQQLSFLSPIVEGTGSLSGGKGSTTYPGPSALSQIGGLGAAATGLSGLFGSGSGSSGDFNSSGFGGSGGDYGGGFDPSSKTGGRIGYARGGTTPDVPGVGNGVPILDLSYIPTETDRPVGSSLGIGIGAGGSQTTSGGGGGSGLLGGIGSAVGAVKTAVDVGGALGGIGDFLGGLFLLKDGGRAGFALGGDTADPSQVDPSQSDPTKLNTSRWTLPKVPKISIDELIPIKGNAGPAIKGKGPPDLQAMPQQMPGQPQDSGLKGIGDLGKSLKGTNLFGSSDDSSSSDSTDKGYASGGVPLSAAINFGGGSPSQSMQVDELRRLPLERLYEMSVRFPQNTPQGQLVARVLAEKQMMPGTGTAPTGTPAQAGASPGGGYGAASAPAAGGMGGQPQDYGGTSHLAHGGEADDEPGFVTEDELDPHPIVDHSGDSVVIRYPSEGKTLDLGLPSIKDERRHYAGGGAAPWLAGVDPALTSSVTSKIIPGTNVAFDRSYYLDHNPDVKAAGVDPFVHYNEFGWHEGRNPSQQFDTNYYLQHNPDVAASGVNPLEQYMQTGRNQLGNSPSAEFPGASLSSFPAAGRAVSPNGVGIPMLATNASAPADRIMQTAGSQTLAPGGGIGNWLQAMPQRTQFGTGPGGSTVFPSATAYTPGMSGVISGLTKGKGTIPPEFGGGPGGTPATPSTTSPFGDGLDPVVAQFFGIGGSGAGNRRGGRIGYAEGGEMDDPSEAPPPREREPDDSGLTALAREQRQLDTPDLADVVKSRAVRSVVRDPPPESREEVIAPKRPAGMRSPLTDSLSLDDLLDKYERTKPPGEGYADIPPPEDRPIPDHREFTAAVPGRDTREFTASVPGIGSPATAPIPVARKDDDSGAGAYEMWQKPGAGFTDPLSGEVLHAPPGGEGLGDHIGKALKSIYSPEPKLAIPEGPPMMTQPTSFVAKPEGIGATATAETPAGIGAPAGSAGTYRGYQGEPYRAADMMRLPKFLSSLDPATAAAPTQPAAAAAPPSPNVTRVTDPGKTVRVPLVRESDLPNEATPGPAAASRAITPTKYDVVIGGQVWRKGAPIGPAAPKAAPPAATPTPPVTRVASPPQVTGTAPAGGAAVEFGGPVPAVVHPAQGYYQGEAAKFTGGNPGNWMGVGDSLAVGYIDNAGLSGKRVTLKSMPGAANADAAGGRSPQEVLAAIKAHPERYTGKNVLLSTGVSNDPSQANLVPQQIEALQDAHAAKIRVLGVGNREGDEGGKHFNLAPYNAQLEQYAKGPVAAPAPATGELERAYPNDHRQGQGAGSVPPPGQGSSSSRPGNGPVTPDLAKQAGYGKDPEGYAELANYLWKGEASDFNVLYGNTRFTSGYDKHPADKGWQGGYGPAGPTHAAGLPQFQPATWHGQAEKLGLTDFSPVNQVKGGLDLAETVYRNQTGGDLLTDFKAGKLDQINGALHSTWTSLGTGSVAAPPRDGAGDGSGGSGGGPRQPGPGEPEQVTAGKDGKPVVTAAGQPVVDAFRKDLTERTEPKDRNRLKEWMDSPSFILFMVGAGMLASRSPFASVALGEGLLAAGKSAQEVRKDQSKEELTEARLGSLAGRVEAGQASLAERTRHAKEIEAQGAQRIADTALRSQQATEISMLKAQAQLAELQRKSEQGTASLEEKKREFALTQEVARLKLDQAKPIPVTSQDENGNPITHLVPPATYADRSTWVTVSGGPKAGGMTEAQRETNIREATKDLLGSIAGTGKSYAEARAEVERLYPKPAQQQKPPTFDPNQPAQPYTGPTP